MELTDEQTAELRAVATSRDVSGAVATRARIVLWTAEGRTRKDVGALAGVALPTVDRWLARYAQFGLAGLEEHKRGAGREQVPARVRARILALTRTTPPAETGLSHWSSREMAAYVTRAEGVSVSWHYVAKLWREHDLKPHRQGTFKLSRDPRFAEKVFDVVGLYLHPPAGAVVLSVDEKTQVQALDRTQPLLPIDFGVTEQRTHDYKRHGTTNLFAALDVATGTVVADCYPQRTAAEFLAFLRKAVKPYAGKEIHVVLDNLSTHDTPEIRAWLDANPNVTFHFTPVGSSWMNQIEIWFGIITRQAIRRGTFVSVNHLIQRIRAYVQHRNADAEPFVWTATADEILAKVRLIQTNIKKLVQNNSKEREQNHETLGDGERRLPPRRGGGQLDPVHPLDPPETTPSGGDEPQRVAVSGPQRLPGDPSGQQQAVDVRDREPYPVPGHRAHQQAARRRVRGNQR